MSGLFEADAKIHESVYSSIRSSDCILYVLNSQPNDPLYIANFS